MAEPQCECKAPVGDHRLNCPVTIAHGPLRRGDVVKTWIRRPFNRYLEYTVQEVATHSEGGQDVVALNKKWGAYRFRWYPGHYVPNRWTPIFVRRPVEE